MKESLQLEEVVLLGRTFTEYKTSFDLEEPKLHKEKILDVASGVSSFCAEATKKGIDVTGLDLIYQFPPDRIREKCEKDLEEVLRQLPELTHLYQWVFYKNLSALEGHRRSAYQLFLEHYAFHKRQYIEGGLPKTPFSDNQFTMTLVSHLLFLYDDRLNYDFHKKSIQEITRITQKEIRIYPMTNLKGQKSPLVHLLMADPDLSSLKFTMQKTSFEFFKGSDEVLIIYKN